MKKKPKKKLTIQQLTEKARKKAVTLAKKIAVLLDKEICQHCGRSKLDGWQMHGSHIYPEGVYKSMSADVDNILCLCATCHTGGFWKNSQKPSWHEDPCYFVFWFDRKYPERSENLRLRSQVPKSCDLMFWQDKYQDLKDQLKKLLAPTP